jgi:hypothetical protein
VSGQFNHDVGRIIQQMIIDLGGLVTDPSANGSWPCYVGLMPDSPDNCVSVRDTEGRLQGREHVTGYLFEKHGIQIRIRSDGPVDGYVKAAAIFNALNPVTNREVTVMDEVGTASTSYRVQSVQHTSPVLRLGPEQGTRRYLWTVNDIVSVRQL